MRCFRAFLCPFWVALTWSSASSALETYELGTRYNAEVRAALTPDFSINARFWGNTWIPQYSGDLFLGYMYPLEEEDSWSFGGIIGYGGAGDMFGSTPKGSSSSSTFTPPTSNGQGQQAFQSKWFAIGAQGPLYASLMLGPQVSYKKGRFQAVGQLVWYPMAGFGSVAYSAAARYWMVDTASFSMFPEAGIEGMDAYPSLSFTLTVEGRLGECGPNKTGYQLQVGAGELATVLGGWIFHYHGVKVQGTFGKIPCKKRRY